MKQLKAFIHRWIWILLLAFCVIGIIYPEAGVIALICMLAPSLVATVKGRMWCGNFCPRGSFNDILLSKISRNRAVPKILRSRRFRKLFLVLLMSAFAIQLFMAWGSLAATGSVFVRMIIITTLITIALGILYSHRAWCIICPMGTMASWVTVMVGSKKSSGLKKVSFDSEKCVSCKLCSKTCPVGIDVLSYKETGTVNDPDCIKCNQCVYKCPKKSLSAV
ncbi:MAG: hypothetical protein K0R50_4410 [Eubacterium sp.]|nr:hypothetical protein [Eubacterium sp.]